MERTTRIASAVALAAALAAPLAADAAPERSMTGRVVAFSPYNLQLDRGPHIVLHNGTVLRPRGLTPANGMWVRVIGHRRPDGVFTADEVDRLPRPWR